MVSLVSHPLTHERLHLHHLQAIIYSEIKESICHPTQRISQVSQPFAFALDTPLRWVESISSPIPINLGISSSQHTPSFPETCPRHYVLYPRDSSLPYWHVHISLWLASISWRRKIHPSSYQPKTIAQTDSLIRVSTQVGEGIVCVSKVL